MKIKLMRSYVKCLLPVKKQRESRPPVIRERPEELIFALCYMAIVTLIQLPFEEVGGERVPTFLFKGHHTIYHAFLISLMFAFSCAASAMIGREEYPKAIIFCRRLAVVSISASAAILMWVAALAGFRWVRTLTLA